MVECFPYTIVECMMGARIFMYEVLPIAMLPILANVMY